FQHRHNLLDTEALAFHHTAPFILKKSAENSLTSWHCLLGAAQSWAGRHRRRCHGVMIEREQSVLPGGPNEVWSIDLVIGVDATVMRVAAALGKSAWILVSGVAAGGRWKCSWSTSEWYPDAVTLFRQEVDESDWAGSSSKLSMHYLR
ncbi:hypothetical protein QZM52_34255, partial [Burkholderia metallica]|nr:hypothetical protein [Burkholderia metallica]